MKKIDNITKTKEIDNKVDKDLKTGSTTDYKVLSDNNFTNEQLAQLSGLVGNQGSFTRLWTGTLQIGGETIVCSDRPINYDMLIIGMYFGFVFVIPKASGQFAITNIVLNNDDVGIVSWNVINTLEYIGTHTIKLVRNKVVAVNTTNTIYLDHGFGKIMSIYGVKFQRPNVNTIVT